MNSSGLTGWNILSSLNPVISTNESTLFITGHMVYNLAYTEILQTTTTQNLLKIYDIILRVSVSLQKMKIIASFSEYLIRVLVHTNLQTPAILTWIYSI